MCEEQSVTKVFETIRFEINLSRMTDFEIKITEDQIELVIENKSLGKKKTGMLSHIRVHKFNIDGKEFWLGYSCVEKDVNILFVKPGVVRR